MPDLFPFQQNPTPEEPMLIGFMIDISLSMIKTIHTSSAISQRRLDGFRDAIDNFVSRSCVEPLTTMVSLSTTSTLAQTAFGNLSQAAAEVAAAARHLFNETHPNGPQLPVRPIPRK